MDKRESTKKALDNYLMRICAKEENKSKRAKRTNPEKETEKEVLTYLRNINCDVDVVEASTWDATLGRHVKSSVRAGFSDLVGNFETGTALFIELKALGRRSTIKSRQDQLDFLVKKIKTNCFACCTDCVDHINNLFLQWQKLDTYNRQALLFSDLPQPKQVVDNRPLFDE